MHKFLMLFLIFLVSCSSNNKFCFYEDNIIEIKDLFSKQNNYYVLVYLDKCEACRDAKLFLMNICNNKDLIFYYLDYNSTNFLEHRKRENNINVSKYEDIYINKVPHLLHIKNKTIDEEYNGFYNIKNALMN